MSKVALVTGGSRGLGAAIAAELKARGYDLLLVARKLPELEEARKSLTGKADVEVVAADISRSEDVAAVADTCRVRFGRLDLLVNNAGVFIGGPLSEFDEQMWDRIIGVNLKGPYLVTRALLDLLRQSRGQIIFINSVGGKVGLKNLSGYSASKSGLRGFADSLRLELKPEGIRVTSIFPHGMNTTGQDLSEKEDRLKMIDPEDVARLVGEVAAAPEHLQVPEIILYPRSTEIGKRERTRDILGD